MSRARSEQGFTIIEVLVAAVILITVIAASSALFIQGSDASLASQRQSQAISVADEEIERSARTSRPRVSTRWR